jgi:hypothetical protein
MLARAQRRNLGVAVISAAASAIARRGGIAPTRWRREVNDAYFTIEANWLIPALLRKVKIVGPVLEPAAGAGHLVRELRRGFGLEVIASDLHAYEGALVPDIGIRDLWAIASLKEFRFVITNLPYDHQDGLAAHLVALGARDGCSIALLVRSEWFVAGKRRALVHEHPNFSGAVHLTSRPRWTPKKPGDKSPRHNFSWLVWQSTPRPAGALPWVQFAGRAPPDRSLQTVEPQFSDLGYLRETGLL